MEGGKKTEAGPSSGSGCCSASGSVDHLIVVCDEKQEKKEAEMADKPEEGFDGDEAVAGDQDDNDHQGGEVIDNFVPGPLLSLKDQIEKDKDDESLRRWKEKLLGCLESDLNGQMEPEVKLHSFGVMSDDFGESDTPLPIDEGQSGRLLFTLREGSHYRFKLTFTVLHNIVSGLTYTNRVWKGGLQVDQSKGMLGTFAPQREPYTHILDEEITPSGVFARGIYAAKLKFEDDDRRCHMELKYSFEIKKSS